MDLSTDLIVRPTRLYDGYIFDLDGTIYLGSELLPGARDLVFRLRELGLRGHLERRIRVKQERRTRVKQH